MSVANIGYKLSESVNDKVTEKSLQAGIHIWFREKVSKVDNINTDVTMEQVYIGQQYGRYFCRYRCIAHCDESDLAMINLIYTKAQLEIELSGLVSDMLCPF